MAHHTPTCVWHGQSGTKYTYYVYTIGTKFTEVPGNYIFCKKNSAGLWVAIYVGETGDLSQRFDGHHANACIVRNGATHIHVHKSSTDRQTRLTEETDLRERYEPTCNKQ
jgi:predicted GIY-YIG superfamily endonuclease